MNNQEFNKDGKTRLLLSKNNILYTSIVIFAGSVMGILSYDLGVGIFVSILIGVFVSFAFIAIIVIYGWYYGWDK